MSIGVPTGRAWPAEGLVASGQLKRACSRGSGYGQARGAACVCMWGLRSPLMHVVCVCVFGGGLFSTGACFVCVCMCVCVCMSARARACGCGFGCGCVAGQAGGARRVHVGACSSVMYVFVCARVHACMRTCMREQVYLHACTSLPVSASVRFCARAHASVREHQLPLLLHTRVATA